jgi:hypothetical protein
MDILLTVHSIIRWIIIVVAALAIIKFTIGWAGNGVFQGMDRGLAAGFSGLMDLQVLLGLIYFIWNGIEATGFPLYRILHMIVMILAAALAHLPARFKTLADKLRFQYSVFAIIGSLLLIVVGISLLPGGLSR